MKYILGLALLISTSIAAAWSPQAFDTTCKSKNVSLSVHVEKSVASGVPRLTRSRPNLRAGMGGWPGGKLYMLSFIARFAVGGLDENTSYAAFRHGVFVK